MVNSGFVVKQSITTVLTLVVVSLDNEFLVGQLLNVVMHVVRVDDYGWHLHLAPAKFDVLVIEDERHNVL